MSSVGPATDTRGEPDDHVDGSTTTGLTLAPDAVTVRRNAGLAAVVGGLGSAVAIAYLARATETHAALDWALAGLLGLLGVAHLVALVDARTPLLVADTQGVRVRLGRDWRGLPWGALSRIEHTPRRGLLRDGRLVMVVHNPARLLEELPPSARRQSALTTRLYGAPFAMPLGLSTRVSGGGADLTAALAALAGGTSRVVELGDEEPAEDAGSSARAGGMRPLVAHALYRVSGLFPRRSTQEEPADGAPSAVPEEVAASETPSPLREPAAASRVEVHAEVEQPEAVADGRELRRAGSVSLVEDTVVWGERVAPIARAGHAVEPLLIDDHDAEPAEDPVIGPEVAAARTRIGLSVDQLAERTRIRPHVIESIEVDDFAPCGGDFYARGHLRTLARVLGVDAAPLLARYDERYSDAPISPRRVFEAELATGSIRGTRGGPNWSVLVAAAMAVVLAWSIARLLTDGPDEVRPATPVLNGSAGVAHGGTSSAPAVPVVLTAEGGGARVVVRDGAGTVVFTGNLAFGETRTLQVSPPVRVQSTDGSLTTRVDGVDHGALGATGRQAQDIFTAEP